jgi:hypothetical protein
MNGRYEIRDRQNPQARGMRFSSLDRAERELAHAVPATRWFIFDRVMKAEVSR